MLCHKLPWQNTLEMVWEEIEENEQLAREQLGDQFGAALVTGVPDCPADFRTTQKHFPFVFAAAKEAVTLRKGTGAAQVKVRAKASSRVAKQIVKPAKRTIAKR